MPLMSISRNFFLGNEPTVGFGPFRLFDSDRAAKVARELDQLMAADAGAIEAAAIPDEVTPTSPDAPVTEVAGSESSDD